MMLADVIEGITGVRPSRPSLATARVSGVVVDSRQVTPGGVFFAEHSGARDGHQFVPDALARGAVAVVVEPGGLDYVKGLTRIETTSIDAVAGAVRLVAPLAAASTPVAIVVDDSLAALQQLAAFWRARMPVRVIGITGSVGKTTTKELMAAVLSQRYRTLKSEASYNNEIGLPLTLLRLTPEHERAVLEMGMYAIGEIRQMCEWARPEVGVETIVGPVHLERLGSIENIAIAKAELVEALPPEGTAILNADDPRVLAMRDKTRARVFTYGLTPTANLWADRVDSRGLEGVTFTVHYQGDSLRVDAPLIGRHSVHTALRAIAVGLVEGLTWEEIIAGLQSQPAQVRLVVAQALNGATLLDDTYNSSPDSSLAALNLLKEMPGRRIAVLGDMLELGAYEAQGHRVVGCRAAEVVNRLIAVGELAQGIAHGARECGMSEANIEWYPNKDAALVALRDEVGPGDFVLIKGSRGMRMETMVAELTGQGMNGSDMPGGAA